MRTLINALETAGGMTLLGFQGLWAVFTPPWRFRDWLRQMESVGVQSLLVGAVTMTFTGMVLALQTAYSLPTLGVKYYIGMLVSKSLVRELGPVLIALVVGGRIGAGITAELGTMKVTDQISALRSMATDPNRELVAPRIAATLLMLPVLTIVGDAMGIFGGLLIAMFHLNISAAFYWADVTDALTLADVVSGVGKSVFFALFVSTVACYNGLNARGGADGVGRATTNTVVVAAILVLVSDFFLTQLFHILL